MKDKTALKTGVLGSAVVGLCCFTPLLVIVFGVFGISTWLGWIDYILLPALAVFLSLTGYGLWRLKSR